MSRPSRLRAAGRAAQKVVLALGLVVVLASCRVDSTVRLDVNGNGSGKVTVTVTADADVYRAEPTLKTDVRNDDLLAAGWTMKGPDETEDGGLTVSFSHTFRTPAEGTLLLAQVNGERGPLKNVVLSRTGADSNSTFALTGTLEVNGGLRAFADDAAIKLLGGAPYADQVSASGLDLGKALGIDFVAAMPGKVDKTTGSTIGADGKETGVITWRVPTDGSPTDVTTTTTSVDIVSNIARFAKWLVAFALVVWVLAAIVLAGLVASRRPAGRSRR